MELQTKSDFFLEFARWPTRFRPPAFFAYFGSYAVREELKTHV